MDRRTKLKRSCTPTRRKGSMGRYLHTVRKMLQAFAYMSRAREPLDDIGLTRIARQSSMFNQTAGVTGVLLFDGQYFFQYIEGPQDGIDAVMGRIAGARAHAEIKALVSRRVQSRLIPYWSMEFVPAEGLELSSLAEANWDDLLETPTGATGIDKLMYLIRRHRDAA